MLDKWIDAVSKAFELEDGQGGRITSYRVFEKNEFPETLEIPCAVTYVPEVGIVYTAGAITSLVWSGETEVHVTNGLERVRLPEVMRYFKRILEAFQVNITLGGLVEYFELPENEKSIRMTRLQYGSGAEHYGLTVLWEVRENVNLSLSG
jgi:hypothetical protein